MKLNYFTSRISAVGRWLALALLCVSTIALGWHGALFSNNTAMAAPDISLIADAGDRAQGKANVDANRTKNFVRDTADKVERTANKNAKKVERATGNDGSFVERKAKRDRDTIERRAEEDTARTQKAIDNTKNVVERTVDSIKDALN